MDKPLDKNGTTRYYELVIDKIKDMIISGQLKQADKLPSERELAEKFGISRVPVREALKILEYMDILDSSRGDGTYVKNTSVTNLASNLGFGPSITPEIMENLLELRVELEASAAYYAALRRTDEDITAMRNTIEDMRLTKQSSDADDKMLQVLRNQSHEFHRCVIRASKNKVLYSIYNYLYESLDVSREFTIDTSGVSFDSILAHEAICNKIINHDCEGARTRIIEHLDTVRNRLKQMTESGKLYYSEK